MNKHTQIVRQLEQALMEGRWKLFERLPAERQLAVELGVNRNTLKTAISVLVGRGILETQHGSGTRVVAMPYGQPIQAELSERLQAALLVMPSIMKASALSIRPSQLLKLERMLHMAGSALRSDDAKAFIQAQMQFFAESVGFIDNASVNTIAAACMPDGKSLMRLLSACSLQEYETLFSQLARILSSMRHADAGETAAAAHAYIVTLQNLVEKK